MCIQMIKYFTAKQDKGYSKQALFLNHSMLIKDVCFRFGLKTTGKDNQVQ